MYVHHGKKMIYLAHPRTASSSTAAALLELGFKQEGPPYDGAYHHGGLEVPEGTERSEWTVFTTVRDPLEVLVSWVFITKNLVDRGLHQLQSENGFPEPPWGVDTVNRALHKNSWLVGDMFFHLKDADVVLQYGHLSRDLDRLLGRFGMKSRLMGEPVKRDYDSLCTPEVREMVYDRFGAQSVTMAEMVA